MVGLTTACQTNSSDSDLPPGVYDRKITVDNLERTYRLYIPKGYSGNSAVPLVVVLHGGGGTGIGMELLTGFSDLAEQENFIAVYPNGYTDNHWADGRGTTLPELQGVNDVNFISTLIDEISKLAFIDTDRIYVSGFSNGSIMGNLLGCEIGSKISAIGVLSGQLAENKKNLSPAVAVGVIYFHGTADPVVPYIGGTVLGPNKGEVISVSDLISFWVKANDTSPTPTVTLLPDTDPLDGTRVIHFAFANGSHGTEVHLYRIENGGHSWPGHSQAGSVCRDIDATRLIWEFFKTQHR